MGKQKLPLFFCQRLGRALPVSLSLPPPPDHPDHPTTTNAILKTESRLNFVLSLWKLENDSLGDNFGEGKRVVAKKKLYDGTMQLLKLYALSNFTYYVN